MKASLTAMLIVTIFVAGITLAYKSAQSLQFIKPGQGISLSTLGISAGDKTSGKGIWSYTLSSQSFQQETGATKSSLSSVYVFEFSQSFANPGIIYAATDAGLYRQESGQSSWVYLSGGMPTNSQILSASVDPKNTAHIYVSVIEKDGTNALFRSRDNGKTFAQIYVSASGEKIVDVINDWYNAGRVLAITSQGAFLRSDDGGSSWHIVTTLSKDGLTHLFMDPNDSRILYALQPSVGMFESTDGGSTWQSKEQAFNSLPSESKTVNDMGLIPGVPGGLYLATNYGILRSENHGNSLALVPFVSSPGSVPIRALTLGKNPQTIFAATGNALYESRDAGNNWETHSFPGGQLINALIYGATPVERLFIGLRAS